VNITHKLRCDGLPCGNSFLMKHVAFRFSFIGIAVIGNTAELGASSIFLCGLVSIYLRPVNAAHLATAMTLCRHQLVVFVEQLNGDRLHLPGGPLPTLKTRGDNKGPKKSDHCIEIEVRCEVQRK
jgi:hypothetical protein